MIEAAIARWRDLLGDEYVSVDVAAATTFATTQRVFAELHPATATEVARCLAIASEERVRIHPVSRGLNWGYGSRVPPVDAALLDLARLDKIVDFDERLAYVTVEPGVTFRQLSRYLRACRARVWASVTGGPANGSVIANALERGDGSGPLGDRFGHLCGLEVALPTGELVHTGFARFPGAPVAALSRWGVGPSIDGLFSQQAMGVVTRATIWLAPYPRHFQLASFKLADDAQLPTLIDDVRELALSGVTTSTIPIWNDLKAAALLQQNPAGNQPLSAQMRDFFVGVGRWNGTVSLYAGSRAHGAALRELVDQLLTNVEVWFREGPEDPLDASEEECGPFLGVPHNHSAAAVYWRKDRVPVALDPDRDRCGFLWLGHAVPCEGSHARAIADLYEVELAASGFEPAIALLAVTPRALSAVAQIAYDRDVPGDDERARACHDRVYALAVKRGYPPFRRGIQTPAPVGEPAYDDLVMAIRRAIDPNGVLG